MEGWRQWRLSGKQIEGLKRSARLRHEDVMQRAQIALRRMEDSEWEINFRTVAAEAGVSASWLYSQRELRCQIMRLRRTQTRVPSSEAEKMVSADLSKRRIIATLRFRIKNLEDKNRELSEGLEHACGMLAQISLGAPSPKSGDL